MSDPPAITISKEDYFIQRLASGLNVKSKIAFDKFKNFILTNADASPVFQNFLRDTEIGSHLICTLNSENPTLSTDLANPSMFKKKGIVALRVSSEELTQENIMKNIVFVEMTRNVLDHLYSHFREIYMPIMHNPENQAGWSDLVSKDLLEKFNNYLAQVYLTIGLIQGKTLLPLPPQRLETSDSTSDKDKAHIFEGSIITWTRQIRNVLNQDPEQALKSDVNPDPLVEIKFWQKKSENLNSIHQQLQSDRVKWILKFLEQNKSTYTGNFTKLQKEVHAARQEANENFRFLKTLEPMFLELNRCSDFSTLHEVFLPIMHTILLIWKHSKYYNTPPRLVVLIREICNAIIAKAQEFISGRAVFNMIGEGDAKEACNKLQTAIDVCTKFKDIYFEYKAKANGGWKLTTNALFIRLDSFLERCHDILHLTHTYVQFSTMEKIEIGGTKGKYLTESVNQIFEEFKEAVVTFEKVHYDIMDISAKQFDDDFYKFRSKIKELERRIAAVITQGFDDCDTVHGRFKLLDSFEGLLSRPIIQDELEKKHIILIESYKQDLKSVQGLFLEGKVLADRKDERAPLYNNLPPIAGALAWCRSLLERIKEPMDKLQNLSPVVIDREEFKDVQKLYQSMVKSIKEYEDSKILQWEKEADESSKEKLKEFLLKREDNDLLRVNFDPALVRLLRETRYFLLLDQSVPQSASDVFAKDDVYRSQICALDMIVYKYNNIKTCLHPVEEPLVINGIKKIDETLKAAIDELTWKSPNIDKFLQIATEIVNSVDTVVQKMKGDVAKIRNILHHFDKPLLERKTKPMPPDDFKPFHEANIQSKEMEIKQEGQAISRLVKEVSEATRADKKSQIWKNYVDYINEIIITGIIKAIETSLQDLNNNIDPENIKKRDLPPLFEIKIHLDRNQIQYEPEIEDAEKLGTIVNTVNSWIRDFMRIATVVGRLDGPGDFLTEIRDSFEIRDALATVADSVTWIVDETGKYKQRFVTYSYLWNNDPKEIFNQFMDEEVEKEKDTYNQNQGVVPVDTSAQPKKAEGGKGDKEIHDEFVLFDEKMILLRDVTPNLPRLSKFDERINTLKALQVEIQGIKTPHDIGWLKIDVGPLKRALDVKIQNAIRVYTGFLEHQVKTTMHNLKEFVKNTNLGIKKNPAQDENNTELLMSVMKTISEVRIVEEGGKTEKLVKRLHNMVVLLKKHGVQIEPDYQNVIDAVYTQYYETSRRVFEVKADILPLITKEKAAIKKRIDQFVIQVQEFRNEFLQRVPTSYDDKMEIAQINASYDILTEYYNRLIKIEAEAKEYENLEQLFELEQTNYKQLKDCRVDLRNVKIFWDAVAMVTYQYNDWKQKSWKSIKADLLQETNKVLMTQIKTLPKELRNYRGYSVLEKRVKNMQTLLPLISSLHSEFMEQRHWQEIMHITGKEVDPFSPTFSFNDILNMELYEYETAVNEVVDKAQKEAKIEKKLKQIDSNWIKQEFEFFDEKEYETKLFQPLDNMIEMLDTNQMDLMGMMSQGKYVEYFKNTVEEWRERLKLVDNVTKVWLKVQKNWRRLVNIFIKSEDIRIQLPEDTKKFEILDKDFREMMTEVAQSPSVLSQCRSEREELLNENLKVLEQCEKALNEYLEEKKKSFPRFYFVSNQALLDILANGNNPHKVVEYLGDCFDGMKDLKFNISPETGQKTKSAKGMYSKEYEYVEFSSDFVCEGAVETWLSNLEFKMRATLAEILEQARASAELWEVEIARKKWVEGYNAQLALVTTQIIWTEEVNKAFDDLEGGSESAMKEYLKIVEGRIADLIGRVRGDLTAELRTKIITIITIDVHSRDVVEKFATLKLSDKEAFAWQSQLKFYWEKTRDNDMAQKQILRFPWEKDRDKQKCIIRIVDWTRFYSYEYVGNCGRLVITPLTDRCYITLTQALNLNMGGAPAGPAGTGKTETTKDLGRAVGLPVMVFNCSDQMNYETMAQIFKGLAQTGAWGCFDEFNRISIEVLSVVSTQVAQVLDALKERKTKFLFMDKDEIALVDTVGFFITMNPGYAGRTELPENLKALFRSCAMVVPDLVLICENMLMSEGFQYARGLSRKFVTLYDLSKSLLSKQMHYDWGLRAIKSVLRQAGKLKREDPDLDEDPLLKRALRDFNMPKVVIDDRPIFGALLDDLFPGIKAPLKFDQELKKIVIQATKEQGFIAEESFALKCVQLSEILEVRHCCFVIGSPGCGKTTIWKTLGQAYINRGQDTMYDVINPKAVSSDELFGYMTKSKEWKDGVLSNIMRNQSKNLDKYKASQAWKWVILDGDIDPEWIESLNTVMDDNKLLTLVSNERIPLSAAMRLLFEVSNLKNATPATVSRGGVLFVNDSDVGWKPYMDAWIERSVEKKKPQIWQELYGSPPIDDIAKSMFYNCFQQYYEGNPEVLKYRHIAPVNDIIMVQTTCAIIDALLQEHLSLIKQMEEEQQKNAYQFFFLFAAMWAIGGSIGGGDDDRDLKDFNNLWRAASKMKYPEVGNCLDYYFDPQKMNWVHWSTRVGGYEAPEEIIFSKLYVPTVQTVRLKYLLNQHVNRKKPLLFAGPAGTGKTAVIKDYLSSLNAEKHLSATINFNSFTDSMAVQKNVESRLEKKSGRTFGLAANRVLIYFIDDLNMPFVDKYGTQTPIALIRQLIDYGMVYDRDHLEEKKLIEDLLFVSCLNPKSGSFVVDLRLQRHFSLFTMTTPTSDILKVIYGQILATHLGPFDNVFHKICDKLIEATNHVFNKLLKDTNFSPSAKKFHYQFNLRELSKVIEGLMMSTPQAYRGSPSRMIKLWVHECKRVFEDRLISDEDIAKFNEYLREGYKQLADDDRENAFAEPNIFTSFISQHYGNDKAYVPAESLPALKKVLEDKLNEYNEVKAVMNLVLFNQAMEHICRICRMLDMPAGHGLLVGVGGSGKQSLAKLSAFIMGVDIDQIVVSQNFTINDLKTFLQELIKKCVKTPGNSRVFMITDSQIKEEYYLVFINDLLSSGFVPDLFPKEELDGLIASMRNEARSNGYADNYDGHKAYFLDKLKKNLHIILAFSPVGEKFRIRARKFPGIVNSTMIDWFHGWPKSALIDVANRFLGEVELPTQDIREAIALNMAECHASIDLANKRFLTLERRYNYTTPKSFLELIDFYKKLLNKKREYILHQIFRLENGLQTLAKTQTQVKGLQEDLKEKMKQVEAESRKTEELIDIVTKESETAEAEQRVAQEQRDKVNMLTEEANKKSEEAQKALEEAKPALIMATEAVKCIDKPAITEMKSLPTPPPLVQVVAKAILILISKDKIPTNEAIDKIWRRAVQWMNDPAKFLNTLLTFQGENIEDHKLIAVNEILKNPENLNFDFNELKKKNTAAAYLGKWLTSMIKYNQVYKVVKPLQDAMEAADAEVATKKKELAVVEERVAKINARVADLRRKLEEAVTKKQAVEAEAQRGREKLEAAEKLVLGLADENKRWGENVKKLKESTMSVIGDVLLSAEFVSYIGAFSAGFRRDLWKNKWIPDIFVRKIPMTPDIEPLMTLTDDSAIANWRNEGLPADQMSLENAAVITSCSRWPLIIDPQLQGSNWIKGAHGGELVILSLTQTNWMNKLVNAITMGKTVLIENLGQEIDATLEPLLSRAIIKKGRSYIIELGDGAVDYDLKFKLFLQTKLSNPHFRPEIAAQCTIINFIVTEGGLEDQLLAMVVKVESPELESEKSELVRKQNEFQVVLAQLEENLLNALSEADPDTILDNKQLIESLDNTKKTAIDIAIQRTRARETETQINIQREIYRKVASEGAMLYFLIISLNFVDHMYQYSLEAFTTFFFKAIERTTTRDENRIEDLRKNIRYTIYQWVSRGLFEKHKLIFLTLITFRLMQKKVVEVQYEPAELLFLLNAAPKPVTDNPLDWLPNEAWGRILRLIDLDEFKPFAQNMEKDAPSRFKDWYNELQPEEQKLPLDWKKLETQPFKKLLVLRCLRPDRITTALTAFIRGTVPEGQSFVEMDQKSAFSEILTSSLEDSTANTPIFFILSPGADPVKDVEALAKKRGHEKGKNFSDIALGQGQEVVAMEKLERGHKEGHWVMLQNIHLMPKWLPELEKKLDQFAQDAGGTHQNFRLFLSAEPSTDIPIGILERCIKLTNEPPAGLKANMKRAWSSFRKEDIEDRDPRVKTILFSLCYFHSTVLERRKFGPKGWNMFYPFNAGDLRDSANVLNKYFEGSIGKIPWDDLTYIFGEIMYGGHIVDDWDRKLCRNYLEHFMNDNLLDELELFPYVDGKTYSFKCPTPRPYDKYVEYVEQTLTQETPIGYGLHPNAEIGFRTTQCEYLFNVLLELQPKDSHSGGSDEGASQIKSKSDIVQEFIRQVLEDMNLKEKLFNLDDIRTKIDSEQLGPYQNVFLQECEYMNVLLIEIIRSLDEVDQGYKGLLTISDQMEQLIDAVALYRVPATWSKLAYPSKRGLASWLENLDKRIKQLSDWKDDPIVVPKVTMISRLFNPQSFLTAIKQVVGRKNVWELNKVMIATEVLKKQYPEEVDQPAKEGAYIYGLVLEGARWDAATGQLDESRPKEMFCLMPVIYCKAQLVVGEGNKEEKGLYYCPSYVTEDRGKTYVFTAQLKTRHPPRKWILAGVALLMDVESVNEDARKKEK